MSEHLGCSSLKWTVVAFGICVAASPGQVATDWVTRTLSARIGHALAYDVARQRVVLFGCLANRVL
jgi:hypothetical protein